MGITTIAATAAMLMGTLAGAGGAAVDHAGVPAAVVPAAGVPADHDVDQCWKKKNQGKWWCVDYYVQRQQYSGDYLAPLGGGYVSAPPGEAVTPLGGGYVSAPPGEAIPPLGGGYVSTPPGVAIAPVG